MNKKLLITSLFATLMLMLPMTSVVGVSDVGLNRKIERIEDNKIITETSDDEDCGCEVVSSQRLVRLERLLDRVKIYTNVISILSNNNPEIKDKCKELSNEVSALREMIENNPSQYPIILCGILNSIFRILTGLFFALAMIELWANFLPFGIIDRILENTQDKLSIIIDDVLIKIQELECPPPFTLQAK